MAQTLVNIVTVTNLAAGATTTLAHGLESNNAAVAPTLVFPDRPTGIAVQSVTTTNVVFVNNGLTTASANFRCERGWQPEVNALTVTPLLYAGGGTAGGASGVQQVAVLSNSAPTVVANNAANGDLPLTYAVPANTYKTGSTVRVRIAGTLNVAVGATNVTLAVWANAAKDTFSTVTIAGVNPGAYPFVFDVMGTVASDSKVFGSTQGTANISIASSTGASASAIDRTLVNVLTANVAFTAANNGTNLTVQQMTIDLAV
jgi:hypothetical protein